MDLIAVAGVNYFLRRHRKFRYLILAAGIFPTLGFVLLLVTRNYLLYCVVSHFFLNTGMVLACFGRCGKKEFLENWAVTYLVVILLGGITAWLKESLFVPLHFFLMAILGGLGLYGMLLYFMRRREFGNHILDVRIKKDDRSMTVKGYWDSGNQLRDPYTGQEISILSNAKAKEFLDDTKDLVRFVPYRSLGEKEGLISVTNVDEILIYDGRQERHMQHMAIGIADAGLLEDKGYDLILHASLL